MSISIDRAAADVQMTGHDNFAQVEPNHLSAPRDGGVYAQLPADESIKVLEQGMIVKYDMAAGKVALTGNGISAMVFNEEKLYDERKQMHRDYAMQKSDFYDGVMTPRVFRLSKGDIFTTNAVAAGTYNVGDKLCAGSDGFLAAGEDSTPVCQVVAETILPDGQPAVKLQVVSE
nr:MAG TPA: hypothetical protein [Caudoviricetes sp.]